jgi:hypothetical protein
MGQDSKPLLASSDEGRGATEVMGRCRTRSFRGREDAPRPTNEHLPPL